MAGRRFFIGAATTKYPFEADADRPELAGSLETMRALFTGLGYRVVSGFGLDLRRYDFTGRLRAFLTHPERQATDVVVVYYTGLGLPAPHDLLLPMCDSTEDLAFSALRAGDLTDRLLQPAHDVVPLAVQQLLFILDTCHPAASTAQMGAEMVGFVNRLRRSGPPSLAALVGWRPDEGASSGVFTRALADAVSHPAGGSHVQEFLAPETLTGLVESSTPDYQHARFIQMSYGPTEFFPNPRFDRRPSGLDLRTQQREQVRRDRAPAGHVFISYSHSADAQYVERLAAFLEDAGVPAWYDREIISGDRWRSVIREQIETCSLLIVVMTPEAEASHWVTREIDWAEKRGKPICPLLLAGDVWFGLNDIQCENVSGGVMPSRAFVDRIRRVLRLPAGDSKEDRDVPLVLQPVRVAALTGHTGAAVMFVVVAFAPNGGIAATGGFDGRVLMWDVSEPLAPRRLAELADQGQWVMALAFSPTGGIMATGGSDTRVLVWDVSKPSNPRRLAEITDHTGSVRAVAFSPDGRAMASGGADKRVLVWDLSTPAKPRRTAKLTDHTEVVFAVAFSADGLTLATGSDDKRVLIWDLSTSSKPRRIAEITDHTAWVRAVAFSPDGRILVTGGADERVLVWDLSTPSKPRRLAELTDHRSLVNTVVFSSDGLMLATGGDDRRVLVWDLSTPSKPRRLAELAHHGSPVNDLAFNPDGTLMASSSLHEGVALWQMNTK